MAIRKGAKESKASLPTQLENLLLEGFSLQAARDIYDDVFKATKGQITHYLEHNEDGFSCDMGKGFHCEQGTVIFQSRSNYSFDKDKILELVESGKLSLATVINLASFNAEKLKTAIGATEFENLATNKPTEYLTMKANAEFKASVEEKFADVLPHPEAVAEEFSAKEKPKAVEKVIEKKIAKKEIEEDVEKDADPKATAAYIRSLKGKSKKSLSADEELNDILGDKK